MRLLERNDYDVAVFTAVFFTLPQADACTGSMFL